MPDLSDLPDDKLQNLINNHRQRGATERPLYADAVEEWHRRHGGELDLKRSLRFLRVAALERRFVSYGELAAANGADWGKVSYPMNAHLWVLVDYAKRRGWPMLSAIIVNKQHVTTGNMDEPTLTGFVEAARALGYVVTDATEFLKQQQELCFRWGRTQDEAGL